MRIWLKYAFNRTLTTFLGPAERGDESHGDYLRRQYLEEKAKKAEKQPVPAGYVPAVEPAMPRDEQTPRWRGDF